MISRRSLIKTTLATGASTLLPALHAQSTTAWPERQVRIVLPFGVGGAAEVLVRELAECQGSCALSARAASNWRAASTRLKYSWVPRVTPRTTGGMAPRIMASRISPRR